MQRAPFRPIVGMLAAALIVGLGGCALLAEFDEQTGGGGAPGSAGPSATAAPEPAPAPEAPSERPTGVVASITDGDTLRLVVDGDELRVRLIGIDTPELRGSECFADEATEALARLAPVGTRIGFEYDDDPQDRFERELMYLYAADGTFINLALVEAGYARELHFSPNFRYRDQIVDAEAAAQAGGLGLWGACL
ncbi:MAG: thermonuclease family protein [Microcella sp.]